MPSVAPRPRKTSQRPARVTRARLQRELDPKAQTASQGHTLGDEPRHAGLSAGSQGHDEARVHAAISQALMSGRLRPGTPLRERYLSEVFSVTRGAVRKVLARLGQEGKLEILPNRGAYVPQPSTADIGTVYEARKAVEAGMAALLAMRITDAQIARLRAHVREERRALRAGRRDESVRLAGDFHSQMVAMLDNPEIVDIVRRLVGRTRMFVALFESARDSGCAPDEHARVIEALTRRDPAAAALAMLDHLDHVRQRVTHEVAVPTAPDLGDILRGALDDASQPAV